MLKVIVNGATGKMGVHAVKTLAGAAGFDCIAALGRHDSLDEHLERLRPNIVLDLTAPEVVYQNCQTIINHNIHPVIGTTGLKPEQIEEVSEICRKKQLGGIIAPNFSISAILMMLASQLCAKYLNDCEIIEMHHPQKKDAPSGTALKTQTMIQAENGQCPPIHSVRLPGLLAHQQVIFGSPGETLTIQHDTNNRDCFMPGVLMACEQVVTLQTLVYGLENIILKNSK